MHRPRVAIKAFDEPAPPLALGYDRNTKPTVLSDGVDDLPLVVGWVALVPEQVVHH